MEIRSRAQAPAHRRPVDGRAKAWVGERKVPIVATVAMVIPVMAYSVLGGGLHGGHVHLVTPGDLWGLVGSSWAFAHGHFGHIFGAGAPASSPPGIQTVFAPVLLIAQAAGLVSSFDHHQPLGLWLLLGPVVLLLASLTLFAVDATARSWGLSDGRRLGLALASALGVANVAGIWGHPEDCIAVAMVLWSALELERRGNAGGRRAALLLGVGIAFQPLAILAVAPVLTRLGWRGAARVAWRVVAPSLLLLIPPLIAEPARTRFVMLNQPFLPNYVSFTPLTHLAPVIGHGIDGGGPTRLVATALSAGLAIIVCRRRSDLPTVLAMIAVAFFLRVLFETALNWYYVWPVAAVCLLLAARRGVRPFEACAAALVVSVVLGNHDTIHHIAFWWPALMISLVVMLGSALDLRTLTRATARPLPPLRPGDQSRVKAPALLSASGGERFSD
jgi:hypothetical protein